MSKRRKLLKKLEAHKESLQKHLAKIEEEKRRPKPRKHLIELWEKHIANIRRQIEKLERRLKR